MNDKEQSNKTICGFSNKNNKKNKGNKRDKRDSKNKKDKKTRFYERRKRENMRFVLL